MAGKIPDLRVAPRTGTGKGAARQARRDQLVPGVVYGGGEDPQPITIEFKVLFKMLKAGGFMSTLFNLQMDGADDVRVVCRGIQRDVVKDLPTHIDFLRLKRDSRINMNIPVNFLNMDDCKGVRSGGTFNTIRPEVELMVTAGNIPDSIDVDVAELEIGDTLTISMVELPEGSRPIITDRDFVLANISAPGGASDDDEEAEGETEEGAAADDAPAEGAPAAEE